MFFLCGGGGQSACPNGPATVTGTVTAANVIGPAGQGVPPASSRRPLTRCATGPLMRMFILLLFEWRNSRTDQRRAILARL